ncbi:MAG: hypothetical protein SFY95_11870 [Planctomycetota bacterium]|nr:hypothetical protein [Planctomycetota bacterium]
MTHARTGSVKPGMIVALVVGAIFASVIAIALVRGTVAPPAQPEAPDIAQIPGVDRAPGQTSAAGGLVTTTGAVIQLTDKRDPGRVAGVIRAAKLEPLEARRYLIEKPRVWYDLKDGRRLWVAADEGRLFMPDRGGRSEPENGTLRGNVTIKLFDRLPAGAPDLDPERDSETLRSLTLLTATTDSINFDGALGEVSTPDRLVVTSERVDFAGTGLRVILSEAQDRIDLLQVQKREYIRYRMASAGAPATTASSGGSTAREGARADSTPNLTSNAASNETPSSAPTVLYRAQFTDVVRVTMGERLLTSDRLDVLVRLVNNRLPSRTTATAGSPTSTASGAPTNTQSTANAAPTPASAAPSANTEVIELLGQGAIELRPIASTEPVPTELTGDDLALRFSGERSGRVRVTDPALGLEAQAASILYRATSQELALAGVGPASVDVLLRGKPGDRDAAPARAALVNYRVNLASGLSHAAGPGVLELLPAGADPAQTPVGSADRRLSWNDQAEFDFETVNGRTTGRLKEARLTGAVEARDSGVTSGAGSSVKGGFLQAMFEPAGEGPRGAREALRIRRLVAREAAEFADGRGGLLRGETLDVAFTTRAGLTGAPVTDPTDIQASGKVLAQRGTGPTLARLEADSLRAMLDRRTTDDQGKMLPGEGELIVTQMDASGKVRYIGGDGITFAGDKAQAEPSAQRLRLTGNASLGVSQGDAGTIVTGDDLTLDGITRRLEVAGQGTFEHTDKRSDSARGPVVASASWKDRMTYDDTTGVVLAEGRAVANSLSAGKSRERLKAQQVRVELSPYAPSVAGQPAAPRTLRRVIATGTDTAPAEVEQRVLEAMGPEIKPDSLASAMGAGDTPADEYARLVFVRSREITADNASGTISAPGTGTMLIVDRRQIERDTQTLEPTATGSGRGNTLFRWSQGLTATRADGRIVMSGEVAMTHERLPDGQMTLLEAERLTARLRELSSDGVRTTQRDARAELLDVEAQGRVYARSGSKELTAERMLYDAQSEQVDVFAAPGRRVTVFDGQRATPVSAERLRWNLKSDTVEVIAPGTISTPR